MKPFHLLVSPYTYDHMKYYKYLIRKPTSYIFSDWCERDYVKFEHVESDSKHTSPGTNHIRHHNP